MDAADNELWKNKLNTLGNLVLLERRINRSSDVLNHPFERKQRGYVKSALKTIERLRAENPDNSWTLAKAQERTEREAQRLSEFLFDGCKPSVAATEAELLAK
jgi:flagellar biosynthesis/type III secretory pathway chaperone